MRHGEVTQLGRGRPEAQAWPSPSDKKHAEESMRGRGAG